MVASTRPRRLMSSAASSIRLSMSSTVAWYRLACSGVRLHQTFISCLSGRSEMIVLSVFSRRRTNGWVIRLSAWTASRRVLRIAPLDRHRVPLAELLGRAEQARVGELHDRPQLGQPVLHRRPGQGDPGRGRQGPDRPGLPGGVVLDVLRLVADHPGPAHLGERGLVPGGHAVRGEDQVRIAQRRGERLALQPVRTVVHVHPEVWGEPGRLPLPVADQRHRADQQRGTGTSEAAPR